MAICAENNQILFDIIPQRDEILFGIVSQSAARAEGVDLKILRRAAILAAPSIAHEHRAGALPIGFGFKP